MTYEEALKAFELAQISSWEWGTMPVHGKTISVHDGITQAIEIFKRIKIDLDFAQEAAIKLQKELGEKE